MNKEEIEKLKKLADTTEYVLTHLKKKRAEQHSFPLNKEIESLIIEMEEFKGQIEDYYISGK